MNSIQGLTSGGSTRVGTHTSITPPARRWRTRIGVPALLLLIVATLLIASSWTILVPATPVQVVPVIVKNVEGSTGSVTVQAPGWLEPDPHPYYVVALIDGVVKDMLVLDGDHVEQDQVVARLIDDDAKLELRRAVAQMGQRAAEVEEARAAHDAAVQTLETLVDRHRNAAVAQATVNETLAAIHTFDADIAVQVAALASITDELQRKRPLVASGSVSEGALRRLELQHDAQDAVLQSLRSKRAGAQATLSRHQAELEAANEHLKLRINEQQTVSVTAGRLKQAEETLQAVIIARDEAQLTLDRTQVRAPIAGIVMRRLTSPGSNVRLAGSVEHSAHIVHLYQPEHLQVRADVPLVDAANVGVGQQAEIIVDVLPDRVFAGVITRMVHEADIAKNTVEVKVRINDPTAELKPEMLARVRLLANTERTTKTSSTRQRIFAPTSLIQGEGDQASALVASAVQAGKGVAERRTLSLGTTRIDNWIEVTAGLQPGDQLIAQPADVREGQRVHITGEASIAGNGGMS